MRPLRSLDVRPVTQKALGLRALETSLQVRGNTNYHFLLQNLKDVEAAYKEYMYHDTVRNCDVAIRPCPPRPRHGYFDTIRVNKFEFVGKVKEMYDTVKADDVQAELLVARWQPAVSSGILTPWSITVGKGNDGATSGRNARTLLLPAGRTNTHMAEELYYDPCAAGLNPKESPYVEFVRCHGDRSVWLTQLRSGPNTSAYRTPDFVPSEGVKVKRVVAFSEEDYTLREWEEAVTKFEPGTVVYHKGGAITCHAGVHCVINNVAYIVTKQPKVGQSLEPTTTKEATDPDAILYGIGHGLRPVEWDQYGMNSIAHTSIFALHNYPADRGELGSYLFGLGAAYTWRLIAAACIGEARHARKHVVASPRGEVEKLYKNDYDNGYDRVYFYTNALAYEDDNELETRLLQAMHSYFYDYWTVGYGGTAWAECAIAGLMLRDSLMRAMCSPTKNNIRTLSMAYNQAIHVVHNNGSPLNKFMCCQHGSDCMNYAAQGNLRWMLLDAAASVCDELTTMPSVQPKLPKLVSTWQSTVDMKRARSLMCDPAQYHEERAWERVAVETIADAVRGKRLKHERCMCRDCSPEFHLTPCIGKCKERSHPNIVYCQTACNVTRKRVGLAETYCKTPNCDVCPGKTCNCEGEDTCHKCAPKKEMDKCDDTGCDECYPNDEEDDYEEDNDDD